MTKQDRLVLIKSVHELLQQASPDWAVTALHKGNQTIRVLCYYDEANHKRFSQTTWPSDPPDWHTTTLPSTKPVKQYAQLSVIALTDDCRLRVYYHVDLGDRKYWGDSDEIDKVESVHLELSDPTFIAQIWKLTRQSLAVVQKEPVLQ